MSLLVSSATVARSNAIYEMEIPLVKSLELSSAFVTEHLRQLLQERESTMRVSGKEPFRLN
jgi:hypothetical protein